MQSRWFECRIEAALTNRRANGTYREPRTVHPSVSGKVLIDGRELVNFGSNDYLALSTHPALVTAALEAAAAGERRRESRWGASAAPLLTGRTERHAKLEADLAAWKRVGAALTFSSGYAAGVSVIPALAAAGDVIFSDALNHASLIDGCRLSKAAVRIYPHGDVGRLAGLMKDCQASRRPGEGFWIVSDSVFSMEGDCAPLADIARLANVFDAGVIVDEAHAGGVYGSEGVGLADPQSFAGVPLVAIGTLSKALGSVGGFVTSQVATIDYLRNFARGYVYSTAMPAAAAAAGSAAIELCRNAELPRQELRRRGVQLRRHLAEIGWPTTGADSPIVPVYTGEAEAASRLSAALSERGFWVPPIRPPTVPDGKSLIRVSLTAAHSVDQIGALTDALTVLWREFLGAKNAC